DLDAVAAAEAAVVALHAHDVGAAADRHADLDGRVVVLVEPRAVAGPVVLLHADLVVVEVAGAVHGHALVRVALVAADAAELVRGVAAGVGLVAVAERAVVGRAIPVVVEVVAALV